MLEIDPRTTFPHVLVCDRRTDRPRQARFFLRLPTDAQAAQIKRLIDPAEEPAETPVAQLKALYELLGALLAGWVNVPGADGRAVEFSPAAAPNVLTADEAWELLYAADARCRPEASDRKNSGSPPPSAAG